MVGKDNQKELFECSECGDHFSSEELLKEHFRLEHPDAVYNGPAVEQFSWKQVKDAVRPYLNVSFGTGFIIGVLLTSAIFGLNAFLASSGGDVPVTVTVLTCDNCSYDRFQTRTDKMFNAKYREVDYQSEEGQRLIEKYNIRYIPGFIYNKKVEEAENFTRAKSSLVGFEDAYVLSDGEGEAARFLSKGITIE